MKIHSKDRGKTHWEEEHTPSKMQADAKSPEFVVDVFLRESEVFLIEPT